jgi:hypothetical protein
MSKMKINQEIKARNLMKDTKLTIEFRVTGVKRLKIRLWIATRLIKLAAWIAGIGTVEFK